MQESVFTRVGVDRAMKFAFELATKRRKKLTSATKSNGIVHTMPYWDQRFKEIGRDYPQVEQEQYCDRGDIGSFGCCSEEVFCQDDAKRSGNDVHAMPG